MTTMEPFVPRHGDDDGIAAAEPGVGAPPQAPGFGHEAEEPDRTDAEEHAGRGPAGDNPFRTPVPPQD